MKNKEVLWKWGWRVGPVGVVVVWDLLKQVLNKRVLDPGGIVRMLLGYGLLIGGWVFGWMLPDLLLRPQVNKYFPEEVRKGMEASIKNALTVVALLITGVWIMSSSGSLLASGMIFGLTTRLFTVALRTKDYKKWYWVIAREITPLEHQVFMVGWAGVLLAQFIMLVRG